MNLHCVVIFAIILLIGCTGSEHPKSTQTNSRISLPTTADSLRNLTIFSLDEQSPDTLTLTRQTVFGSNEEVLIEGYISKAELDRYNNLYILAQRPGLVKLYVFGPGGDFQNEYDLHGKGPGEFISVNSMDIVDGQMILFGRQKLAFYTVPNFTLIKDELLKRGKLKKDDPILEGKSPENLFVQKRSMILSFNNTNKLTEHGTTSFFNVNVEGNILPGQLLEVQRFPRYLTEEHTYANGYSLRSPFTMPFTRETVVAVSPDGPIYTAWTEDFLIKVYDKKGNYIRAFYYPVPNSPLDLSKWELQKTSEKALEHYAVPNTWPVIHTMLLDDENRLWICTITESETNSRWWVLDTQGNLLARFSFPLERKSRSVEGKSILKIKDGYFYRETKNKDTGIDRIVKYKINFKPNEI